MILKNMASRLMCWYVFNVFVCLKKEAVYLRAGMVLFVAIILDNLLKSYGLSWGRFIWAAVAVWEIVLFFNIYFCEFLSKKVVIHPYFGNNKYDRFFGFVNGGDPRQFAFEQSDYLFFPKGIQSCFVVRSHVISENDVFSDDGLLEKKIAFCKFDDPKEETLFYIDIFVYFKDKFDLTELFTFIGSEYYNTGKIFAGYEDYVIRRISGFMRSSAYEAEDRLVKKMDCSSEYLSSYGQPIPENDFIRECIVVLNERVSGLKLLSNIARIKVSLFDGNDGDFLSSISPCNPERKSKEEGVPLFNEDDQD